MSLSSCFVLFRWSPVEACGVSCGGVVSPLRWSLVAARWSGYRLWVALALVVVSFSSNLVGSVVWRSSRVGSNFASGFLTCLVVRLWRRCSLPAPLLYMGLVVKWVYTVPGWWTEGSNLQFPSPNDDIVGLWDPFRAASYGVWGYWKLQEPCVSRFEGAFLSGSSWRLIARSVQAWLSLVLRCYVEVSTRVASLLLSSIVV
ncbi:hypothetical protein IGI04_036716 [Brassica rapa subsp. trilocularis]|uniref:Uncharacterized protein n=1 Tax=Brassica rapa subsp. trilocularis TaxID=1813537 RepID=A0ABQ7LF90_BRACM|nr:hypothetical protein IGI04_036716 [Brassica rapa subsp. trilocularis]